MGSAAVAEPSWQWREDRIAAFWRFVAERHNVFIRRVVERTPPPWTRDRILQSVYFTNVYRELDRGTRYLIVNILPHAARRHRDGLFSVLLYRFFNLIDTYEFVCGLVHAKGVFPVGKWNATAVARALVKRQKAGHRLFTGAYMVQAIGARPGVGGKAELVVDRLTQAVLGFEALYEDLRAAPSMEAAHARLTAIPGIAGFNAYEIVIDLCYQQAVLPFHEDDWVHVGPGALRGLNTLLVQPVTHARSAAVLSDLRTAQRLWRRQANVTLHGPDLTLRNVEHSLCEWFKYFRAQEGGRSKRGYREESANPDYTLWDGVSPAYWTAVEANGAD